MSRAWQLAVLILAVALTALPSVQAWGHTTRVIVVQPGHSFCPSHTLALGSIIIQEGRCFSVFLMRTHQTAFFAFVPAGLFLIPPGQLVRLDTPLGARITSRIFLLLPITSTVTLLPVNTIRVVIVRIEDAGSTLGIRLVEDPATVVTVIPAPAHSGVPVPDDARLIPPGREVPPDEAAFSGKWVGQWEGKWRGIVEGSLPHVLTVEEIARDDLTSASRAVVVFAWGTAPRWGVFRGWYRVRGVFERGILRLTLPSGGRATYRMSIDGTLDATYERADFGVVHATMKRMNE